MNVPDKATRKALIPTMRYSLDASAFGEAFTLYADTIRRITPDAETVTLLEVIASVYSCSSVSGAKAHDSLHVTFTVHPCTLMEHRIASTQKTKCAIGKIEA